MDNKYFLNWDIRESKLFVVFPDGSTKDEIGKKEAIEAAEELGLDLVKIADDNGSGLPVCKIQDFGRIRYLESKKKKNIYHEKQKRMTFGYTISDNDLKTKFTKVDKFISKNHKVEVSLDCRKARAISVPNRIKRFEEMLKHFESSASCSKIISKGRLNSTTLSPL